MAAEAAEAAEAVETAETAETAVGSPALAADNLEAVADSSLPVVAAAAADN